MKYIKIIFSALLAINIFNSCSTDVDIYADYKEISIVYGLLDSDSDTTFLKVTKAFSGPGNALIFAQNADSSNYQYKLDVKLKGIKNGVENQTITFDTITLNTKQAGDSIFYYPKQLVYYTTETLSDENNYQLEINRKGDIISSETDMISSFSISYPNRTINFIGDKEINWKSGDNGKRYEVRLIFNYKELMPNSIDTTFGKIEMYMGSRKAETLNGGESLYIPYSGDMFYSAVAGELEEVLNIKRWAGKVDVVISSASQEFDTYLEVNSGNTGLLSEVPVYTNINGGYGIFASRRNIVKSVDMTATSMKKLVNDYPGLGFQYNQ